MAPRLVAAASARDHAVRDASLPCACQPARVTSCFRRSSMQWTTPTACDLRFGFEITMYVSAR